MNEMDKQVEALTQTLHRLDPSLSLDSHRETARSLISRYGEWDPPRDTGFTHPDPPDPPPGGRIGIWRTVLLVLEIICWAIVVLLILQLILE